MGVQRPTWRGLEGKIDAVEARLEAKIDAVDAKIDAVEARLEAKIDALQNRVLLAIHGVRHRNCGSHGRSDQASGVRWGDQGQAVRPSYRGSNAGNTVILSE